MSKNIVIILCDELRKDSLQCYGNSYCKTPNIDGLANDGVLFNRCYAANPICMPNRMSIFTGMYPRNHGLWTNGLLINENSNNLGNHFIKNGYTTASKGKIHFEPYEALSESRECMEKWKDENYRFDGSYWGFENIEMTLAHTRLLSHYKDWIVEKGGCIEDLYGGETTGNNCYLSNIPCKYHSSTFVGDRSVEYINEYSKKDKPFVLVASFPDPHHPFDPPRDLIEKTAYDDIDMPIGNAEDIESRPIHYTQHSQGIWSRGGLTGDKGTIIDEKTTKLRREYTYAMIELIDNNIGRIIKSLKDNDIYDDTIVVFTSDHGELLGDHGLWYKGPFFYEGLISVPLIIKDNVNYNKVNNNLFSSIDIYPTLCDMVGIEIPYYVDGISQKKNIDEEISCRDYCLTEYRNGYGDIDCASMALILKDYKYTRYQNKDEELTDLANDPDELKNVINDERYHEIVNKMRLDMLDILISTQSKSPKQISGA